MKHIYISIITLLILLSVSLESATPWWDNYPLVVQNGDPSYVLKLNGDIGFSSDNSDPSWGIYAQATVSNNNTASKMHKAGLKFISYYEAYGDATSFIIQLGNRSKKGYHSVFRNYWNWNRFDSNGKAFHWAGPHNYFDAEKFCGIYTRLHPIYGGGRAMTYPDGKLATGYFDNDSSDPRKSRVFDAGAAKDILGNIRVSTYAYLDEIANNSKRKDGLLKIRVNGKSHLVGHMSIAKDTACPMWIDQQRSSVLHAVKEWQIDGFWTDNFSPWDNFGWEPVKNAFGDWSVALFRDYLAEHFSTKELKKMGIKKTSTFDVRSYLRQKLTAFGGNNKNLEDPKWSDPRWLDDPVWRAFRIFKRQIGTKALTDYYKVSKTAAASMGKPEFAVLGNDIPLFSLGYCRGELDLASTEISPGWHMGSSSRGFMMPPVGRFAPLYKLGHEHTKSRLMNVWMYLKGPNRAYKENEGLVNVLYYEMLANHALPMIYRDHPDMTQNVNINSSFFGFVKKSRKIFAARKSVSDVGIYYSSSSILADMTPLHFSDMDNQSHAGAYWGWSTALGALHYQYRGVPEWKLSPETLSKLKILIIPHAEVLDVTDVETILKPWVKKGGKLIVTGNSGLRRGEADNFSPHSKGLSLFSLTGVAHEKSAPKTKIRRYGKGRIYYLKDNLGLSYFKASTKKQREALISNFIKVISKIMGSQKSIIEPVSPIPETVGINVYQDDQNKRFFVDVNNYKINLKSDTLTKTPPITFTVEAPPWLTASGNIKIQTLSPSQPPPKVEIKKLTGKNSNRIQVKLGSLSYYASLVFEAK